MQQTLRSFAVELQFAARVLRCSRFFLLPRSSLLARKQVRLLPCIATCSPFCWRAVAALCLSVFVHTARTLSVSLLLLIAPVVWLLRSNKVQPTRSTDYTRLLIAADPASMLNALASQPRAPLQMALISLLLELLLCCPLCPLQTPLFHLDNVLALSSKALVYELRLNRS